MELNYKFALDSEKTMRMAYSYWNKLYLPDEGGREMPCPGGGSFDARGVVSGRGNRIHLAESGKMAWPDLQVKSGATSQRSSARGSEREARGG